MSMIAALTVRTASFNSEVVLVVNVPVGNEGGPGESQHETTSAPTQAQHHWIWKDNNR